MTLVWPRLSTEAMMQLTAQDRAALLPGLEHEMAAPAPNGTPAAIADLEAVRSAVLTAVQPFAGTVTSANAAAWDKVVGAALHDTMDISPSDASNDGVWAFMALVLMPDLASERFPGGTQARFMGGQRNVFRRTWWRHHVLGDLPVPPGVPPLGEDEMVNIFERSRLSRDHRLARMIAEEILAHTGSARSQFARDLSRHVRALTGPIVVEMCPAEEVRRIVSEAAEVARPSAPPPPRPVTPAPPPPPPVRISPPPPPAS